MISSVKVRNSFETPQYLELYLNLPEDYSLHHSMKPQDPLEISKGFTLQKDFLLKKQETRDESNKKKMFLEAKKIEIVVQKIENDVEANQMDVIVKNSSPFRAFRKMIVKEDEIELGDNKEQNNVKIAECEKKLRAEIENLSFNGEGARKELFIARYIKKSAKAFGATQGQIFHDNFTIIPANYQVLDKSDELRLRNFIFSNNDLCLVKGDFNQEKNLPMNASIQKANAKIKMNINEIYKIEEIINSQQEKEEWFIGFKEKHTTERIQENDGLIYDLTYEKNDQLKPQMLVCVTVYNENAEELTLTLNGISENAERFLEHGIDPRELTVVIIVDGIKPIHESLLVWLDEMLDVVNPSENPVRGVMSQVYPNGRDVKNHVWPIHVSRDTATVCQFTYKKNFVSDSTKTIFLNTLFVAKHANGSKLSSHVWFFQGFCKQFDPKYCVLLDCGTIPHEDALLNFYLTLEADKQIGGCCGYMSVSNATIFGIEGAQLFEYTFAHIVDKALEGLTGFIHVLPGAFSAYRWDAINSKEIFKNYFKVIEIKDPKPPKTRNFSITRCCEYTFNKTIEEEEYENYMKDSMTCKERNMYLAEDRILCLDIYCRKDKNFVLKYVPHARSVTDVMQNYIGLLNQRRRWINGAWFAFLYNWKNMSTVLRSSHNFFRIFLFYASMLYAGLQTALTYIIISLYYVVAKIIIQETLSPGYPTSDWQLILSNTLQYGLLLLYFALFIYSLHFKSQEAQVFFRFSAVVLGIVNVMSFTSVIYFVISILVRFLRAEQLMENEQLMSVAWTSILSLVLHVIVVIFTGSSPDLIKGLLSFIIYSPSYINTMLIYSFCNIDDVSWGTRESSEQGNQQEKQVYKEYKLGYLVPWITVNLLVGEILSYLSVQEQFRISFIINLAYFSAVLTFFKIVMAITFYIKYYLYDRFWIIKLINKLSKQQDKIETNYTKYVRTVKDKVKIAAKNTMDILNQRQKLGQGHDERLQLIMKSIAFPSKKFKDKDILGESKIDELNVSSEVEDNDILKYQQISNLDLFPNIKSLKLVESFYK